MQRTPSSRLASRPHAERRVDRVRSATVARRARAVCALGAATLVCGCYDMRPMMDLQPSNDVQFKVELSDQARVAVANQLGPEVREVTGRVLSRTGDDVLIAVREVVYLRGDILKMSGDSVHLNRQTLTSVTERKFSLPKTLMVAVGVAAAVGVFLGSKSLFGQGGTTPEGPPAGGGTTTLRHP